jgi:hypothetical protein
MKPTDAPNSNFIGITIPHVSGSLSAHHEFLAVHRHWYIFANLITVCYEEQNGTHFHPAPGSKRSSNLQKCTNADVLLRTHDGQRGCLKHVES